MSNSEHFPHSTPGEGGLDKLIVETFPTALKTDPRSIEAGARLQDTLNRHANLPADYFSPMEQRFISLRVRGYTTESILGQLVEEGYPSVDSGWINSTLGAKVKRLNEHTEKSYAEKRKAKYAKLGITKENMDEFLETHDIALGADARSILEHILSGEGLHLVLQDQRYGFETDQQMYSFIETWIDKPILKTLLKEK